MIVKDTMVVIHLAKIALLEKSCEYFKPVVIPEGVHEEILEGQAKGYEDVQVIKALINAGKLGVRRVRTSNLLKRAEQFNVRRGEAETFQRFLDGIPQGPHVDMGVGAHQEEVIGKPGLNGAGAIGTVGGKVVHGSLLAFWRKAGKGFA